MTSEQFMAEAAAYYGDYNPVVAKYVVAWLRHRSLDARTTAELWVEVIKAVSSSYRTPPDVKALEDALRAVKARDDRRPELRNSIEAPEIDPQIRELAAAFIGRIGLCLAESRDPREDQVIKDIVEAQSVCE